MASQPRVLHASVTGASSDSLVAEDYPLVVRTQHAQLFKSLLLAPESDANIVALAFLNAINSAGLSEESVTAFLTHVGSSGIAEEDRNRASAVNVAWSRLVYLPSVVTPVSGSSWTCSLLEHFFVNFEDTHNPAELVPEGVVLPATVARFLAENAFLDYSTVGKPESPWTEFAERVQQVFARAYEESAVDDMVYLLLRTTFPADKFLIESRVRKILKFSVERKTRPRDYEASPDFLVSFRKTHGTLSPGILVVEDKAFTVSNWPSGESQLFAEAVAVQQSLDRYEPIICCLMLGTTCKFYKMQFDASTMFDIKSGMRSRIPFRVSRLVPPELPYRAKGFDLLLPAHRETVLKLFSSIAAANICHDSA